MAQLEEMRLPAGVREALVDDPSFLRQMVAAALNRFLDAEITEHLQSGPYERSQARTGMATVRARSAPAWVASRSACRWIARGPSGPNSSSVASAARRRWWVA